MSSTMIGFFAGLVTGGVFGLLVGLWLPLAMRDRMTCAPKRMFDYREREM